MVQINEVPQEKTISRKQVKATLHETEHLLSLSQGLAHIGSWGWDLTGPIKWSDELYRVFGVSPETFSPTIESFLNCIHPEDRPALQQWLEACGAGQSPNAIEYRSILPDGSIRFILGGGDLVYDSDGKPVFMAGTAQDISERRKADVVLRDKHESLRSILETTLDGYWRTDAQGHLLDVNATYCMQSGYTREELLDMRIADLEAKEDPLVNAEHLQKVIETGRDRFDSTHRRKDGSIWHVEVSTTFRKIEGGQFFVFLRDTTERKAAEEALRESQAVYRDLVENTQDLITRTDGEGRFLFVNGSALAIFGLAPAACIGLSAFDFVHPDDREATKNAFADWLKSSTQTLKFENRQVSRKGAMHLMQWRIVAARNASGEITGFNSIARDVTEMRNAEALLRQQSSDLLESEARFHAIFDNARDGIVLADFETHALSWPNKAFLDMTGYTLDEIRHLNISDINPKDDLPWITETFQQQTRGEKILAEDIPVLCKDGHLLYADINTAPLKLDGRLNLLGQFRDITERRQMLAESVRHSRELSEALNAALIADHFKDELLANVSHELRTPLNAVIGLAELARGISVETKQRQYLDKIVAAGKNLAGIINDLLDISKIAAGQMEFESISFSLRQLILRTNSVMAYKAAEKGLQLIESIADDVPDVLQGDPLRVEQILMNLLSNAIKFTPSGRVELRVSLAASEANRICLNIKVEDSGIGMGQDDIAKLFKPFSQTDASMTRKFGGTGLGLSLCKRLVEMMDGEIQVTSREGEGSTFSVRLWLGLGDAAALPSNEEVLPARYRDVHVLVVDDQPFNRDVAEGLLCAVGVTPCLATNGQEALDMLGEHGPNAFDLILMDIQMPVMDGVTAARGIRARSDFAEIPIIAMTAHTMAHETEKTIAAGMNDHIGKPFNSSNFYRTLAKWIAPSKQHKLPVAPAAPPVTPAAPASNAVSGFPEINGIDTRVGLDVLMGDEARYRRWLAEFVDAAPISVKEIGRQLAAGQQEHASQNAHTLKGRVGMLGMKELHIIATALDAALEGGEPADKLIDRLQQETDVLCDEIRRVGIMPSKPLEV